ncbi:MAG: DUF2341 domain-containing protein, partial [Promethearchaeota archaeon]
MSTSYSLINDGNWHHVAGVADAAAGELRIIVDGEVRNTASYTGSTQMGTSVLHIGNNPGSVGLDQEWDGRIDEVRVSKSVRSADWIATSYINQDEPDAFYTVGWESGVAWWNSDWNYRREISVIAGASAIPSGYSVNVTFNHATLVGAGKSLANGDDIRIAYWDGSNWNELNRALDTDSSWNDAFTTVWFKTQAAIPASTTDDNYYLYYGNPSASSPPADRASIFLFWDGFESGDLSAWDGSYTDTGDTLFVVNYPLIPVHSGTLAARANVDNVANAQAQIWKDFTDKTSLLARIHIYLMPGFSTTGHVTVMQYVDTSSGWQNQLSVSINSDMTIYMWNAIAGEAYGYLATNTISTGAWHTLEMQATISDTSGEARLWMDGNLEAEATGINLGTGGIDRFCTAIYWTDPKTEPNTVIVDDSFLRMWATPDSSTALGTERTQTQDFQYKKDITVDHNRVTQDMTNFPVFVDLYDTDLRTDVQPDGDDIVFVSGGVTLNHEIELFDQTHNSTHAHLVAWVKANLSNTVDTVISMYYGNPAASSTENPIGVWEDYYVGVWHLGETSGVAKDSTGGMDGTLMGSPTRGATGQMGQAVDLDGIDDYISLASSNTQTTGTYSFWVYNEGFPPGPNSEVNYLAADAYLNRIHVYNGRLRVETATDAEYFDFTSSSITAGSWLHIVFVRNGDTGDLYVDGSHVQQDVSTGADVLTVDSIGGTVDLDRMVNGTMDEVRILDRQISAGWVSTEHNNQREPSTFYSVGVEEQIGGGQGGGSGFRYSKDITIDHTRINSDLADFPVMIELYDTDLRSDAQSDGDDIVFKNGSIVLDHEIELFDQTFNSTHGHLVAWVRLDLSSTVDTTITMYYGDPAAENQENPSGVWNSNYVAVWHMSQDPSSSNILDSTMNGFDLTPTGFASDQRIYDGRLGTAISVDGIDDRFSVGGFSGPVNDFTFQSWFAFDNAFPSGSDMYFFAGNSPTEGNPKMRFAASSGKVVTHMEVTSDTDETAVGSTSLWYADSWYQFAFVRNMAAVRAYHYVNGSLDGEDNSADNANPHLVWDNLYVLSDSLGGNMWGPGAVSEFRISSVSLSADWIAAEYANQYDSASFYAVGLEEDLGAPPSYAYKKDITIDHTKVDSDLNGFPVLIDIYDADLRTDVQAGGDDIIFKKGGVTLAHEIELFDQAYSPTHAHLVAWVLADLSSSTDTVITMYYGDPSAENQEDSAAVWSNSYLGVWHLGESSGDAVDSTLYGTNGAPQGGLTQGVGGQVDGAYDFLGSNGRVNYGDPADGHLDFGASDDFTISSWVYLDTTGNPEFLVAKRPGVSPIDTGYVLGVAGSQLTFQVADGSQGYSVYAATDVTIPAWHYVTVVWDDDSAAATTIYMDGADDKESTSGTLSSIDGIETTLELTFGAHVAGIFASDGRMDEVRIASVARPSGWISTEYNNQYDPASFYSVSSEMAVVQAQETDEFKYAKDITVDSRNVVSDLMNFPLLIELYDTDLHSDSQVDGDDIAFVIDDEILDHEIELFDQSFNSTHGHLLAWVRVPFLSSTVDTQITMLYGNSAMDSQQNPSGVWGSRYAGVWHLGESSGNAMDSTVHDTQGSPSGAVQGVSGTIGSAYEFNGAGNVNLGDPTDGHLDFGTSSFTYSLWVRFDATTGTWQLPIHKGGSSAPQPGYEIETTSDGQYFAGCLSDSTQYDSSTWTAVDYGEWMYLVAVVDRASDHFTVFKNAADTGSGIDLSSFGSFSTSQNLYICSASYPINGAIDEVRISRYAHTLEWIYTEYVNQLDPGGFISVSQERLNVDTEAATHGVAFTTNADTNVQMSVTLRVNVSSSAESYTNDLSPGTSFRVTNGSLTSWTTKVKVSPPTGISDVSFSVHYPTGEWSPTTITNPLGAQKSSPEDWHVESGVVIVGHHAVDAYGIWTLEFQDRNHVMDLGMGLVAGQLYDSGVFNVGDDIRFRTWSSGSIGSTLSMDLIAPNGTTWYSGLGDFVGQRYPLPYQHKKDLVIDHTKVDGDLRAFPMLVEIFDVDLHDDVRADGADIAFAVGDQVLDYEVEVFDRAFNSTHAHLIAWVQVPYLSSSADTTVSMYYGNPAAPSIQNPNGVWDSNYVGVWHLGETGTGLADEYTDSSVYENHGQGGDGNVSYLPTRVPGPIGFGQNFSNHFIDCGNASSLDITGNQITLQLWMQYPSATHPNMGPFNHKGWYSGYRFTMSQNSQNIRVNLGPKSTGGTYDLGTGQTLAPNAWHHVVATYDGSLVKFYVDGNQDVETMVMTTDILSALPDPFRIGHGDQPEGKAWTFPWIGQIDEVRISNIGRSGAWIQTEFENQKNPQDFIAVGSEETVGYCDSESISLDNAAPEGEWLVVASYSDAGAFPSDRVGLFTRSFTVRHNATLALQAPSDAVADHITATMIGNELYFEVMLEDQVNSRLVTEATVTLNWTESGVPSTKTLNDLGGGRYGMILNTSDLGSAGRWRIEFGSYHQYYRNATEYLFLDLSHESYLTYVTPEPVPYGSDFSVRVTLRDSFDNSPLAGATLSSNGTFVGPPSDFGNGTYLVTLDGTGYGVGLHSFSIQAIPADSYIIAASIDVRFTTRPLETEAYPAGSDPTELPWGQELTVILEWHDIDNGDIGIPGGAVSGDASPQLTDLGNGAYSILLDTRSYALGTHVIELTLSKPNYQSATTSVTVNVIPHQTVVAAVHNDTTPVGVDTYVILTFLDIDAGSTSIPSGNLSLVTADWGTGSSTHGT